MERDIYFSKSWFMLRKRATKPLTWNEALKLHKKGEVYTVLIDSDTEPTAVLDVMPHYIGVYFLDSNLRNYMYYEFKWSALFPTKLFLRERKKNWFIDDSFTLKETEICSFNEDGHTYVQKGIPLHDDRNTTEIESYETIIDLSDTNYADYPEFGEYDEFIRIR